MSDEQHDQHDGIVELDNPAPPWWQNLFYATIVFAFGYVIYYHVGDGPSQEAEFAADLQSYRLAEMARKTAGPSLDNNRLIAMVKEPASLKSGKAVYDSKCASCHANLGQGLVGPNLTDSAWIHGNGSVASIYEVIDKGVAEKGMPPWGPLLKQDELMEVSAYVASLRGTNPPQPKAPQGAVHESSQ